jgi:hypothetical protein
MKNLFSKGILHFNWFWTSPEWHKLMYKIILYNDQLELKKTLNLKQIIEIWEFSAQINGWLSDMSIVIDSMLWENNINIFDIIQIFKSNQLIYSGFVIWTNRILNPQWETIQVNLVWLCGLLNTLYYSWEWNDTASNIIKNIIDDFNEEYWFELFTYDTESIPDTEWDKVIQQTDKTYLEALEHVADAVWMKFFIWADRKVYFQWRWTDFNHSLTLGREILEINRERDGNDICNYLEVIWWEERNVSIYQDENTQYKKKEKIIEKTDIITQETIDDFWNTYIENFKEYIKKTSLIVAKEYNYYNIKPMHLLKIKNIWENIWLAQVVHVTYWRESANIELETYDSLGNIIFTNL